MAGCAVAVLGLIVAAAGAPPPAPAAPPSRERAVETARAPEPDPPSAELLLYLAEFVDADGETVDPEQLPAPTNPSSEETQPRDPD